MATALLVILMLVSAVKQANGYLHTHYSTRVSICFQNLMYHSLLIKVSTYKYTCEIKLGLYQMSLFLITLKRNRFELS